MLTQQQRDAIHQEALAKMRKASLVTDLATIPSGNTGSNWPVKIRARAGEYFEVCGRGTSLHLYLTETASGYLVSVPNYNRCGLAPADCDAYNVMEYVGLENQVDATTLAAGIRYLISVGLACGHPAIPMVTEELGD